MSHLSTLDPVDDVAGRAAPPAGGPGAGAGVPGDGDHDQLAGVHPDGVQGLHGPLLDKLAGRLHCDVAPVTPVRGLLVTSDSAGDNGRVESGERRAGVTLSPEWSDRAGAGVRRERGEM